ncbi:hypothetical protein [Clostridium frigidicarnis]|uniref:DUF5050 domain-containing protein n=1 Tax=Clostridium frigidicarnis TaxID=84698 RepID=A0A1I0W0K0_9CLOT|nr:hypothetical protein [Clostridium frigidicarnis]SFA81456.1 hypothetical protein SAMN04488528_1003129 [Clostridium frigidicarnis]
MKKFKLMSKYKNPKFIIFTIISLSIISIISVYYLMHYNKSYIRYTENNIVVKTNELNLEYDELPEKDIFISMVNSSKILIRNEEGIWLYDRDKNEKKLISRVLNNDHVFENAVYSNGWVVWIEDNRKVFDGDKVINESEGLMGESWIVVAKNINTDEQIIIDKSHKMKDLKYIYSPDDIEISNDTIVYKHIDFQDDDYVFVVKTFDLSTRNLDVIETIGDIKDKWITDVSIHNNKIGWINLDKKHNYSDLYLYDIDTKEKTKLDSGKYGRELYIYKDKIYATNHDNIGPDDFDELREIDINTKEIRKIIDGTNHISKYLDASSDGIILLSTPHGEKSSYYDIKSNDFKDLGENKFINYISNGYIIYYERIEGRDHSKSRIIPIEEQN